jgi:hypothetical protein
MQAHQQGSLDGLCGLYSLVNAVRLVMNTLDDDQCDSLFAQSLAVLEQKKSLAHFMTNGLSSRDLSLVFKKVIQEELPVQKFMPFHKKSAVPLSIYWDTIMTFLSGGPQRAVILGLETKDWSHWSVGQAATTRRLILFDCDGRKQLTRKHCTTGEITRGRPTKLSPYETCFFSSMRHK